MPHVIVKLWPGKSEQQKIRLAGAITKNVMDILQYGRESVFVAMEEVQPQDWVARVYKPDIKEKCGTRCIRSPVTMKSTYKCISGYHLARSSRVSKDGT